jgi:hypothetical protein
MCNVRQTIAPRQARSVRVFTGTDEVPTILEITVGGNTTDYHTRRVPSDFGQAFELRRDTPEDPAVYHVLFMEDGYQCECLGFLRWGRCKHPDAVVKLVQLGKL